jgi:hypothetical protein
LFLFFPLLFQRRLPRLISGHSGLGWRGTRDGALTVMVDCGWGMVHCMYRVAATVATAAAADSRLYQRCHHLPPRSRQTAGHMGDQFQSQQPLGRVLRSQGTEYSVPSTKYAVYYNILRHAACCRPHIAYCILYTMLRAACCVLRAVHYCIVGRTSQQRERASSCTINQQSDVSLLKSTSL